MKVIINNIPIPDGCISNEITLETVEVLKKIQYRGEGTRELRGKIIEQLYQLGWSYPVKIDARSKISITSVKEKTGLCIQTGNMSRFYADLLKLQALYANEAISESIYIIPTKKFAKQLGSNIASMERFAEEFKIFSKIITVPITVLGFDYE